MTYVAEFSNGMLIKGIVNHQLSINSLCLEDSSDNCIMVPIHSYDWVAISKNTTNYNGPLYAETFPRPKNK